MKYKCLKCDIVFGNKKQAAQHIAKTGSYSPMTHETRLHNVVEVKEE